MRSFVSRLAVPPAASLAVSSIVLTAAPVAAQPRASQHGTVSQTVNTTTIVLEYDRPVLRRRSVFGDILDYDVVWTPGANRATWIEVSEDVRLTGADGTAIELEAGRYGIWTIPREAGPWEIVFVREWDTHHSFFPSETEAGRITAVAERGAHMEVLAFYFPIVGPYSTTLRFHWGDVVVPISIEVGEEPDAAR